MIGMLKAKIIMDISEDAILGRIRDYLLKVSEQDYHAPRRLDGNYVYAIGSVEDRPVKVGMTREFKLRLSQMQTGNPENIKILMRCNLPPDVDAREIERSWHSVLSQCGLHVRGEWFKDCFFIFDSLGKSDEKEWLYLMLWANVLQETVDRFKPGQESSTVSVRTAQFCIKLLCGKIEVSPREVFQEASAGLSP